MQPVSENYNAYPCARFCDFKAIYRVVDETAAGDVTNVNTNSLSGISQMHQVHDGIETMTENWATFEPHGWKGDGSQPIAPDDGDIDGSIQTGWWSVASNENGQFVTDPWLEITLGSKHNGVGFTVIFDEKTNQYPAKMTVTSFDEIGVIDIVTIDVTSARQEVFMPIWEGYNRVRLSFPKTAKPYQTVRVAEVIFGIIRTYDKNNIKQASIVNEVSPIANNLPSNELRLTIDNSNREYDLISPNSIYAYLEQNQHIDVEIGISDDRDNIEYIPMGRFFYSYSEAEDNSMTATITAHDLFYKLDDSVCRIGTTGTWDVSVAVAAVLADSGLSITAEIPAAAGTITINKCIPSRATHREALRLIAQAARCTCYFNREGKLKFIPIELGEAVDTIDFDKVTAPPKITISEYYDNIWIDAYNEYTGGTSNFVAGDSLLYPLNIENPLVGDGSTGDGTAAWILGQVGHRINYEMYERGNPALEIGDTVTVYDDFGENKDAVIIEQEFNYNGTLNCKLKGWSKHDANA